MASMLQAEGADYLAVALPLEGVELRRNGIGLPILVLTAGTDFFPELVKYHLEPGIPNLYTLKALCEELNRQSVKDFPIHIKLDSGMHRLGFMPSEISELATFLQEHKELRVVSLYSHLAAAEDPQQDLFTLSQIELFTSSADKICSVLDYRPLRHILNSAGIERFPQFQMDMVRLGIGLYGISALPDKELEPVASLKVKVLQVKTLSVEDGSIGYGRKGAIPEQGCTIATIPVGYADGIDRHLGCGNASFCVNGHRAPTVGNICMDMCMIDVSGIEVKEGDTVTIFGSDPSVQEIANILNTIPYEILSSVPRRIERIIL